MSKFTKLGYERFGKVKIEVVHANLGPHTIELHGEQIRMGSARYRLFKENLCCVKCGIEGRYYAVETSAKRDKKNGGWIALRGPSREPHLNLYAINKQGHEVLMTKDHVIPKSKGGTNTDDNYQTMCSPCNNKKGNKVPEVQQELAYAS